MADFTSIQALIEAWWKEQRPEGDDSSAPTDLPIYRELFDFAQRRLKESKIIPGQIEDVKSSYMAVNSTGKSPFHVVPADDPPMYEPQAALHEKATQVRSTTKHSTSSPNALLPVNTVFMCTGFYDYIDHNGLNTYGVSGHKTDTVTYELHMTSGGLISGSSKDTCGKATLDGTIDCETGKVELAKRYSWCNLWAVWKYQGQLEEIDGKAVILGRWESGRFAIWLNTKAADHEVMMELLVRVLDARDAQIRSGH